MMPTVSWLAFGVSAATKSTTPICECCSRSSRRMLLGTTGKFVAYYRVSTQKQDRSGLGLAAQRQAVADFLNGGDWRIVGGITEVESGKKSDRPELARALAMCRLYCERLVIAKLDRNRTKRNAIPREPRRRYRRRSSAAQSLVVFAE